jgi:site-specific DNA recombinase
VQAKLVLAHETLPARPDRSLKQTVARARIWYEELAKGKRGSIAEIAEAEGITGSKVAAILELAFLAPELVERIVAGTQPTALSTTRLVRDEAVPAIWREQVTVFGSLIG